MSKLKNYISLCDKYNCYSYYSFCIKIPFKEMEDLLKDIKFHENVNIACRYVRKMHFDKQKHRLFQFMKQSVIPVKNDFFEILCKNNEIDCKTFANDIIAWLECRDFKKNTLKIIGEVNSGKTLIANLFRQVFICSNWLNSSTGSAFNFGNLIYTCIIIVEEPFVPPTLTEDFKSLCGGATLSVDVKYSTFENLERTPVLITSNFTNIGRGYSSLVSERAIDIRSYYYYFNSPIETKEKITPGHLLYFLQKFETNNNGFTCRNDKK